MRFYNGQHRFYVGIDLHARFLHHCVFDGRKPIPARRTATPQRKNRRTPKGKLDRCRT